MAIYGTSPFDRSDIPQLVGIKTNVGGYFFDAVLKFDHERSTTITDHPVEEGANITDHAYVNAKSLSMEIGMSDVCSSLIEGQFLTRSSRSVSAYDVLQRIQEARVPISINTRLAVYHNMLIENMTTPDDYLTQNGLKATVFFREIFVVRTSTATLPNRTSRAPQKTGNTNRGAVQPATTAATEDNRSTLRRAFDSLTGGR